ncbi:MAG: hypothetical protein RIG62_24770 [Cyclobacteriaceae bacterium]
MADLIRILIFLSGSAVLGFLLGRRSRNSDLNILETQAEEKQRAFVEAKSKLDRCTAKRAMLEREMAGIQQGKAPEKVIARAATAEKPVAKTPPAEPPAAKKTEAPAPESKPVPKKATAKKTAATAPKKSAAKAPATPKPKAKKTPTKAAAAPNKQDEALERVKANAERVNFDRIGRASEAEKDDLKRIKGVGPFLEKKLNTLGIYTFAQIGSFTDEDKEAVNEAIEFFPGRISRDNWVDQAKALQQEKG